MPEAAANIVASEDALAAMHQAIELLKFVGFEFSCSSMKSEACYYTRPGWNGAIRVSTHRYGRGAQRQATMPVVSVLTFGRNQGEFTQLHIENRVCEAIGRYEIARARALKSMESENV